MKFKFNRRKIKYVVKPEEKMVIGWIDLRDYNSVTGIYDETRNNRLPVDWLIMDLNIEDVREQDSHIIKAVSKCDDRDEFDEKIGKKIVADIIEKKYHILILKKYKQCERSIKKILVDIFSLKIMHNNRLKELQARIDKYNEE